MQEPTVRKRTTTLSEEEKSASEHVEVANRRVARFDLPLNPSLEQCDELFTNLRTRYQRQQKELAAKATQSKG